MWVDGCVSRIERVDIPLMRTTTTQRVARTIRAELARRSLTQADLAAALGISQQGVSRRLAGHIAFDTDELSAAAELLGLPTEALFNGQAAAAAGDAA